MFGVPKVRINSLLKADGFRKRLLNFFKNVFADAKVLPFENRTLVVTHTHEDVFYKIYNTLKPHEQVLMENRDGNEHLFNGNVSMSSFRITKRIAVANSFLPVLTGFIEPTRSGCLIFVKYRMMPSSIFLLVFTTFLFWGASAYLLFVKDDYILSALSFISVVLVYTVAILNFNKLARLSHQTLIRVLQ